MRGGSIEVFVVGLATLLIIAVLLVRGVLVLLFTGKAVVGCGRLETLLEWCSDAAGFARPCHHPQPREGGGWIFAGGPPSLNSHPSHASTQDYRANGQTR